MRLILSRKGFDSSAGKKPNLITEDGALVPLPIPDKTSGVPYDAIASPAGPLGQVVPTLTRDRSRADHFAHLDPDLDRRSMRRSRGWRPSFGQAGAAQGALAKAGVGKGDLFLFFGWFRQSHGHGQAIELERGAPDLHVVFGWLRVGRVIDLGSEDAPRWAADHPHVRAPGRARNTLYVASDRLGLARLPGDLPGGGLFNALDPRLVLTEPGQPKRSLWSLPRFFAPRRGREPLGYHSDPARWTRRRNGVRLQSAARGQEFVLEIKDDADAMEWLASLPWPAGS